MSGFVTAACRSCGLTRARARRWCLTRTTGHSLLSRRLRARHLRQHEDGGRERLRWQGPSIQPPIFADVQPLLGRADRLYPWGGLGEGAGGEPGGAGARALLLRGEQDEKRASIRMSTVSGGVTTGRA